MAITDEEKSARAEARTALLAEITKRAPRANTNTEVKLLAEAYSLIINAPVNAEARR